VLFLHQIHSLISYSFRKMHFKVQRAITIKTKPNIVTKFPPLYNCKSISGNFITVAEI